MHATQCLPANLNQINTHSSELLREGDVGKQLLCYLAVCTSVWAGYTLNKAQYPQASQDVKTVFPAMVHS